MNFHPATDQGPMGGPPSSPKKRSKVGMILMIVGGVILLLSIIIGVILAVVGLGSVANDAGENQVLASGTGSFSLEEGEVRQVYAVEGEASPACTIYGPDNATPTVDEGGATSTITEQGETWESFATVQAIASGEHQIECDGPVMVGPPVSVGGVLAGAGGIIGGVLGGGLGLLLLIVGLVVHIMTRRKA